MWELDYKESWALKNWCFWTVVLEKTLESPLDCKEIQPVNPNGNQSWIFIGILIRTDALMHWTDAEAKTAEAKTPILWPPDAKNDSLEKTLMLDDDWKREEKWTTEGEMIECHHRLDISGPELSKLRELDGQGGLACCSLRGRKEWYTTEWLNWTDRYGFFFSDGGFITFWKQKCSCPSTFQIKYHYKQTVKMGPHQFCVMFEAYVMVLKLFIPKFPDHLIK